MFHQWCQISLNMGCLQFWAVTPKGMKFCRIWENFRLNIHSYIYLSVHFPSSFLLTYKAKSDLLRPKSSPNLASETQIQPPDSGSETQIWPQDPNLASRPKSGLKTQIRPQDPNLVAGQMEILLYVLQDFVSFGVLPIFHLTIHTSLNKF